MITSIMAKTLSLHEELARAGFGDKRLSVRLGSIVAALSHAPGEGLPRALRTTAALEATYRFMSNAKVTPARILEPHIVAACQRSDDEEAVLLIQDTTELEFEGESRVALGRVSTSKGGFFAHVALAVSATSGTPLGIVGLRTWARTKPALGRAAWKQSPNRFKEGKESERWRSLVAELEAREIRARRIHVMDREGDQYVVLAEAQRLACNYVVRAKHLDRVLVDNDEGLHTVNAAAVAAPVVLERQVHLAARVKRWQNTNLKKPNTAPRASRTARLSVSATTVEARRSCGIPVAEAPPQLPINIVRVVELNPPDGEAAVEWVLLTNLPVASTADVEFVIDCYRRRWMIEELFKALKTGCNYEKLQLESEKSLTNALAVMLPLAVEMLRLRALSRSDDAARVNEVITKNQLAALRAVAPGLPPRPTSRDVLLAVAAFGGHIKNNGDPGWLVLYRGWRDLMLIEMGMQSKM